MKETKKERKKPKIIPIQKNSCPLYVIDYISSIKTRENLFPPITGSGFKFVSCFRIVKSMKDSDLHAQST